MSSLPHALLLLPWLALAAAQARQGTEACRDGACQAGEEENAALLQSRLAQKKTAVRKFLRTGSACRDRDAIAVGVAAAQGIAISGCADVGAYCDDIETGAPLLCCATCSGAPPGNDTTDGCDDDDSLAKAVAAKYLVPITGCADVGPYCDSPEKGELVRLLCCSTCSSGSPASTPAPSSTPECKDDNGAAVALAKENGLDISGCFPDAVSYCFYPGVGPTVQEKCCATCSRFPCKDDDEAAVALGVLHGVSISGCAEAAPYCFGAAGEDTGAQARFICCQTCAAAEPPATTTPWYFNGDWR